MAVGAPLSCKQHGTTHSVWWAGGRTVRARHHVITGECLILLLALLAIAEVRRIVLSLQLQYYPGLPL